MPASRLLVHLVAALVSALLAIATAVLATKGTPVEVRRCERLTAAFVAVAVISLTVASIGA